MIYVIVVVVGVLLVIGLVWLMRSENRRDDRRAGFTQPEHPGFGDITPETVHKAPWPPAEPPAVTLHGATHRQYPLTSPAAPAPPGAEQGTAAAAGHLAAPAPSPPPLPGHIAAHPEQYPFTEWLRDDVAEADWTARALAETEALVKASYYKPLGGA